MKLPSMTKDKAKAAGGIKPINLRARAFTVRWTITDGIQKESYEQNVMAENKSRAEIAWEAWYKVNRQKEDRQRGWYVLSTRVREAEQG